MTHITDLPHEILSTILSLATRANEAEGARYTYGLTQAPLPLQQVKLTKYVRGPLSAESLRWDATHSIRQVCSSWHEWALGYNLEHIFVRIWRGSEKWANLACNRCLYGLYELIQRPSAQAVYRDPYGSLKSTDNLLKRLPSLSKHIRRLWFNGFHTAETDRHVLSTVAQCHELQFLSVPWTVLRRCTAEDWIDLLNKDGEGSPLHSLELHAVCLPQDQALALSQDNTSNPLKDPRVDFSTLKRLKIFGNTTTKPISDQDLELIAQTATNLEVIDITNLSTITVAGMLALVKSSHNTLQVLEHSPRSDDGFFHPRQGNLSTSEHICEIMASLPQMRDLSVSIPSICPSLFSNHEVRWEGECQVRASDLCEHAASMRPQEAAFKLRQVLDAARRLIAARKRMHCNLSIELFFAGCIFEPEKFSVHGDFVLAEIRSNTLWPRQRETSTKGPYGTTGCYGKDEGNWDMVFEDEFLEALEKGWVRL